MLLRFGVANHRSLRDYQELLLTASSAREGRLTVPVPVADAAAVPVAALYGANASGKSNLLDAMDDMQRLIALSHKHFDATDRIPRFPFLLDSRSAQEPTRFECSFTLDDESTGGAPGSGPVYDLDIEFTQDEIRHERLRRSIQRERRSTHTLYTRRAANGVVEVDFGAHLQGENQVTAKLTRPNSLFLSAAAQNNHPQLTRIHAWFSRNWHSLFAAGPMPEPIAAESIARHGHRNRLNSLLRQAEAGVREVDLAEVEPDADTRKLAQDMAEVIANRMAGDTLQPQAIADNIISAHSKRLRLLHESATGLVPLDYESESRGTRMFLTLALPALNALSTGGVLLIDELDSSLHPQLAEAFVSLFLRPESNPKGAQLVFSTHDVSLLGSELIEKDNIYLVDKDRDGASSLTPATDFQLRGDVERAYRNGRLGGAPNTRNFFLDLAAST